MLTGQSQPDLQDKTLALIGAKGAVGKELVRFLTKSSGVKLKLGQRGPVTIDDFFSPSDPLYDERSNGLTFEKLDLYDVEQLNHFTKDVDLVINCAGPSLNIGDRVAHACINNHVPYLDPGGYDRLWSSLQALEDQVNSKQLLFVINAGLFPGLSGLFPRYIIETYTPKAAQLECVCVGSDQWSMTSALDIIDSLGDFGLERAPSYIDEGVIKAVPFFKSFQSLDIGPALGQRTVSLLYTEEMADLAQTLNLKTVHSWVSNHGPNSLKILTLAKLLKAYRRSSSRRLAAKLLCWASKKDMQSMQPAFVVKCRATEGETAPKNAVEARIVIGDTYIASGIFLGLCTLFMLDNPAHLSGVYMPHGIFNAGRFLSRFKAEGYDWQVTEPSKMASPQKEEAA